jgi:hypothetical protein
MLMGDADRSRQAGNTSGASRSSGCCQSINADQTGCDNGGDDDPPEEKPVKVKRR